MKNLFKYLNEGILDIDALDAFTDKTMVKKWAGAGASGLGNTTASPHRAPHLVPPM